MNLHTAETVFDGYEGPADQDGFDLSHDTLANDLGART